MKIMLGYCDFGFDNRIQKVALDHAKAFKARLHLVGCVQIGEDVPKTEFDTAEQSLENGKQYFSDQGINCVTSLVETGLETGEALVHYAVKNKIDEMIIGVRNRSKLGKLIFGSEAQYIILNSPCPVVAVRDEA